VQDGHSISNLAFENPIIFAYFKDYFLVRDVGLSLVPPERRTERWQKAMGTLSLFMNIRALHSQKHNVCPWRGGGGQKDAAAEEDMPPAF
jgi:hypothetical protein